jgi:undecaprenyl-diphosphatase
MMISQTPEPTVSLGRAKSKARVLLLLAILVLLVWAFLALNGEVREQETMRFDRHLLMAFRSPADPATPNGPRWLRESARDISALGGFTVLTLVSTGAVALLAFSRRRAQALIFGVTVALTQVAAETIKGLVGRPRPDAALHLDLVYSSSFPSGHAAMTPVVYLTLALLIASSERRRGVRLATLTAAGCLVFGVGVSRVYLGVHWPTDVLAGWILGVGVALAAAVVLHRFAPRSTAAFVSPEPQVTRTAQD